MFSFYRWQVVEDGYELFANRQLVTIFSAPNYCGEFDNAGAMMSVDETLMCSFQILKPADKKSKFNFGSMTTAKPGNTSTGVNAFGSTTAAKPGNSVTGIKVNEAFYSREMKLCFVKEALDGMLDIYRLNINLPLVCSCHIILVSYGFSLQHASSVLAFLFWFCKRKREFAMLVLDLLESITKKNIMCIRSAFVLSRFLDNM